MSPIYEVGGQLYVVPDVHLDEVAEECTHCDGAGCDECDDTIEDEDNGWCQGCDRNCDQCNCGCLLCEGYICIEPTKWKALREAIDAVCFSNTPDHAAAVRALLDAEEGSDV